jgi:peptide/nickel transport system substrate-binding protein
MTMQRSVFLSPVVAFLMVSALGGTALAQTAFAPAPLSPEEVGAGPRLIYLHNEYPSTLDPQNTSAFVGFGHGDVRYAGDLRDRSSDRHC